MPFQAQSNQFEQTLVIHQRDVKQGWSVLLNGRRIGTLDLMETPTVHTLRVKPGALHSGTNELALTPPAATDDILLGEIALHDRPLEELFTGAALRVQVREKGVNRPLPCRITVVTPLGELAALKVLRATNDPGYAERPGVVYTRDGQARIGLLPGDYTVYASRGFEYGVATQMVTVLPRQEKRVNLTIAREVPTRNWIAADTHIHTLTHSGHGDATIDERVVTIAGEGIELAIATDHNHHADYKPAARRQEVTEHFQSVIGNEVTTIVGHFNAFPIAPGSPPPDYKLLDWAALTRAMRATPGVEVITLNHPRDKHSNFIPLGATNFNAVSGENLRGGSFEFDALEVVTSAALQSDIGLLFEDWFALLNRGYRIAAIGSSDTHDVSRFIVGHARTYVWCPNDRPPNLDLNLIWKSFRSSRLLVSMGLLVQMEVAGRYHVGDLVPRGPGQAGRGGSGADRVVLSVYGPSWIAADQVALYANGRKIQEQALRASAAIKKAVIEWKLPAWTHDYHLVAIATGPGVIAPYWELPRPYQPSTRVHAPRVIGATNPVWVDADGDGDFQAARVYAERLVKRWGMNARRLVEALQDYDESVATQTAAFLHEGGWDGVVREMSAHSARAQSSVDAALKRYLQSLKVESMPPP